MTLSVMKDSWTYLLPGTHVQEYNPVFARAAWMQTRTLIVWLLLLALSTGLAGCALFQPLTDDSLEQRVETLEAENDSLKRRLDARDKEAALLQLEALENAARLRELEGTLKKREQDLKQAQERLLRIDSRIRTLTGPAQAASAIAEAEAAYRIALAQGHIRESDVIAGLLGAGTSAYEAGKYAQAAELADQVLQGLYRGDAALPPGQVASVNYPETAFMNPVPFRVRVNSHVRQGPGMGFAPKAIFPLGTPVTGHAARGQWVKILGPNQQQGWIYRKLLAAPD